MKVVQLTTNEFVGYTRRFGTINSIFKLFTKKMFKNVDVINSTYLLLFLLSF